MVELLLKNDARDDESKALATAIKNGDDILITKLLAIKVITVVLALIFRALPFLS